MSQVSKIFDDKAGDLPRPPRRYTARLHRVHGRMRLTQDEVRAIKRCASDVFGVDCEVTLFGSRVDDTKRGGDIDLYVVADKAALADELSFKRVLESALGERRVDLVLRRRGAAPKPIDAVALSTGLRL